MAKLVKFLLIFSLVTDFVISLGLLMLFGVPLPLSIIIALVSTTISGLILKTNLGGLNE